MNEVVDDRIAAAGSRPLFCELSGGLDSSYVSSVVASKRHDIGAYMYSFPDSPSHRSSEEGARVVAKRHGIDLKVFYPRDFLSLDLREPLPYRDEPSAFFWQGALFCPKIKEFVPPGGVIFSGFGSDQVFMRSPFVLLWLMRSGMGRQYVRTLLDFARHRRRSAVSLTYQTLISQLPRSTFIPLFRAFQAQPWNPFNVEDFNPGLGRYEAIPWIKSQRLDLLEEERARSRKLYGDGAVVRLTDQSYVFAPYSHMGPYLDPLGIHCEFPYCDPRVIEFALSGVSWHLIHDWSNPAKHLLRLAQKGTVPEEVRTRKKNEFFFDGIFSSMLRQNRNYLRELLSSAGEFDGLRHRELGSAFELLFFGKRSNSAQALCRLLAYLLWIRDFRAELNRMGE